MPTKNHISSNSIAVHITYSVQNVQCEIIFNSKPELINIPLDDHNIASFDKNSVLQFI